MTFDWSRLSPLGLGTAPLGNLYREVDAGTAQATVDAAWEAGIRYFDTAPHYGLGLAERRLGSALSGRARAEYVVSTKVGRLLDDVGGAAADTEGFAVVSTLRRRWDFSAGGVNRSIESSCVRLGLDRVDIALVHDPDSQVEAALDGAVPALVALRDAGVVDAVGIGVNTVAVALEFVRRAPIDVVLIAGRCSLLDGSAVHELLPLCARRGVGVVVGGVFNSGLLATSAPQPGNTFDYAPANRELLERAQELARRCAAHGVELPSAALAYPWRQPAVRTVLVGAASPEEITADAEFARAPVPESLWTELERSALITTS